MNEWMNKNEKPPMVMKQSINKRKPTHGDEWMNEQEWKTTHGNEAIHQQKKPTHGDEWINESSTTKTPWWCINRQ